MRIYPFVCNNEECEDCKDNVVHKVSMRMSEYTDKQYCPRCGYKMVRTIESLVAGASVAKCEGFYRNLN